MRSILIDPYAETVTEVTRSKDYKEIYSFIDCSTFDVVRLSSNGDGIYVDDEGLLNLTADTKFFTFEGFPSPLAGKGLVCGCNLKTGNCRSCRITLEEVKSKVKFYTLHQVRLLTKA